MAFSASENFVSGFDGTSSQFLAVELNSSEEVVLVTSDSSVTCVGFLENAPASGAVAEVTFAGFGYGVAGSATLVPGDELMVSTSTGKLVLATATNVIVAKYLPGLSGGANPASTADTQRIRIYIYDLKDRIKA